MSEKYNEVPPPDTLKPNTSAIMSDALSKARAIAAKLGVQQAETAAQANIQREQPPQTPTLEGADTRGQKRGHEDDAEHSRSDEQYPSRQDSNNDGSGNGDDRDYYYRDSKRHESDNGRYQYDSYAQPVTYQQQQPPVYYGYGGGGDGGGGGGGATGSYQNYTKADMTIPSGLVGLFIGRAGDNLRQLESAHRVRIQVIQNGNPQEPTRPVTIEGRPEDVSRTQQIVADFITTHQAQEFRGPRYGGGYGSNYGGSSATVLSSAAESYEKLLTRIPNNKVGLVIGRRGDNVRILQNESGAKINVTPDHSHNPNEPDRQVEIIGTKAAVQTAEAFIREIVETESFPPRSLSMYGRSSGGYSGGGGTGAGYMPPSYGQSPQQPQPQQGSMAQETMVIPASLVGVVIGRGGENVRQIKNESRCAIHITQDAGPGQPRMATISGTPEGVAMAKSMIEAKMAEASAAAAGRGGYGTPSQGYPSHQGGYGATYSTPRTPGLPYDPMQTAYAAYGQQGYNIQAYGYPGQTRAPDSSSAAGSSAATAAAAAAMDPAWAAYYAQMGYPGFTPQQQQQQQQQQLEEKQQNSNEQATSAAVTPNKEAEAKPESENGNAKSERDDSAADNDDSKEDTKEGGEKASLNEDVEKADNSDEKQDQEGDSQQPAEAEARAPTTTAPDTAATPTPVTTTTTAAAAGTPAAAADGTTTATATTGQWTNKQAAEYYAYYAATNPEYAQYAQYYQQLAATDPDGIVAASHDYTANGGDSGATQPASTTTSS